MNKLTELMLNPKGGTRNQRYSVVSGYFSDDDMEAARTHNQRIIDISGNCQDSTVCVTFEFFRAFEKDAFLQQINAKKSKRFMNTYEVGNIYVL